MTDALIADALITDISEVWLDPSASRTAADSETERQVFTQGGDREGQRHGGQPRTCGHRDAETGTKDLETDRRKGTGTEAELKNEYS